MILQRWSIRSAVLLFLIFAGVSSVGAECWFLHDESLQLPDGMKSIRMGQFLIYADDFQAVNLRQETLKRSVHFLQTQLGWKFPYTRKDLNVPLLEVYFISAGPEFTGTVRPGPVVVLNARMLQSPDFEPLWIHSLAHAAELMYRPAKSPAKDYWFYEATAGWMEGQFTKASAGTRWTQHTRRLRPQLSMDEGSPDLALGASLFLDLVARPYRDVIRQTWEQWSYAGEERVMDVLARVLQLNHLPSLRSYFLNYYLRVPMGNSLVANTTNVVLRPYSAVVIQATPEGASAGGVHLSFQPKSPAAYSAAMIYYAAGEKEGILTLKEMLRNSWSISVPFSSMARYKFILVNGSSETVQGSIVRRFDSTIPAVLEYFRATHDEEGGGVQLEWKTARENGVAFWNLYRMQNGARERLNSMPIPASVDSTAGLNYMFIDYTTGAFYSLEAITGEGFPGLVATTGTQDQNE